MGGSIHPRPSHLASRPVLAHVSLPKPSPSSLTLPLPPPPLVLCSSPTRLLSPGPALSRLPPPTWPTRPRAWVPWPPPRPPRGRSPPPLSRPLSTLRSPNTPSRPPSMPLLRPTPKLLPRGSTGRISSQVPPAPPSAASAARDALPRSPPLRLPTLLPFGAPPRADLTHHHLAPRPASPLPPPADVCSPPGRLRASSSGICPPGSAPAYQPELGPPRGPSPSSPVRPTALPGREPLTQCVINLRLASACMFAARLGVSVCR